MAQDSWPSPSHDSRNVTDAEYERIAQRFSDDGVYGSPSSAAVVTAGAGLSVDVSADVAASLRGHAWTSGTTAVNLAISANASGSTRIDRVVLRLDRSDWTVRAVVREGTPGAGAPALVQDQGDSGVYEIPLAQVSILSGALSVTVTREELYVGGRIRPALSTQRNPMPVIGEMVQETDTGRVRVWTGTSWGLVYSASDQIIVNSPLAAWSSGGDSVLQQRSGSVHLRTGTFTRTGGSLSGATESRLPVLIPADYRHPNRDQYQAVYISGLNIGRIAIYPKNHVRAGQVWLIQHPTMANGDGVGATSISWAVD